MRSQTLENRLFHAGVKGVLVGDLEDMTHRVAGFESEVQVLSGQPRQLALKSPVVLQKRKNFAHRFGGRVFHAFKRNKPPSLGSEEGRIDSRTAVTRGEKTMGRCARQMA